MNIPKAYIGGFQKAIKLPRMLFIIYFANIFTALILALTFNGVLKNSFGQSGILTTLLSEFDFTAFSNMMFDHGDSIMAVLGGIKWFVLAYYLLSVFLTGGIIQTFNTDRFTTSGFFGGSAYNFFRLLGLSFIMIFVQFIFILIVYVPLSTILSKVAKDMTSETTLYYIGIGGFVFHLLIFLLISLIGDYAKLYLVKNDSFNVFKGFWNGVKYVFGHFLKTYFLNLILLLLPTAVMYLYLYLERDIKMATIAGILIVFGMQQAFMLLRIFLRTWVLASEFMVYDADFVKQQSQQTILFSVLDTKTNTEKELVDEPKKETVQEQTPTIKEEKTEIKTGYAIDFSKTFTDVDEADNSGEKIITEEEMLKKVSEEQDLSDDEKLIAKTNEKNAEIIEEVKLPDEKIAVSKIENETNISEESNLSEENVITHSDETDDLSEVVIAQNIEKVEQNVINLEDESGEETKKGKKEKTNNDMIEFEL